MGRRHGNTVWTLRMDAELAALHDDGLSATQIARTMSDKTGRKITRNAILGRCHRLKLQAAQGPGCTYPNDRTNDLRMLRLLARPDLARAADRAQLVKIIADDLRDSGEDPVMVAAAYAL